MVHWSSHVAQWMILLTLLKLLVQWVAEETVKKVRPAASCDIESLLLVAELSLIQIVWYVCRTLLIFTIYMPFFFLNSMY